MVVSSAPSLSSPTAISMAETRTIVTTCITSPRQADTTPQNCLPLLYPWYGGFPAPNKTSDAGLVKPNNHSVLFLP